jgi:hypothetical protein
VIAAMTGLGMRATDVIELMSGTERSTMSV